MKPSRDTDIIKMIFRIVILAPRSRPPTKIPRPAFQPDGGFPTSSLDYPFLTAASAFTARASSSFPRCLIAFPTQLQPIELPQLRHL